MAFIIYNHGFINIDQIRFARIEKGETGKLDQIAVFVQGTADPLYLVGEYAEAAFDVLSAMTERTVADDRPRRLAEALVRPKQQRLVAAAATRLELEAH